MSPQNYAMKAEIENKNERGNEIVLGNSPLRVTVALAAFAFLIYYFSNPKPQQYYDYTFRVAENILRGGGMGFVEKPPSWLNEFVPFGGEWFSVFPFGAVVSMMPFAVFKVFGIISQMPGALIAALSASLIAVFLCLIAARYEIEGRKPVLLIAAFLFGTWMWTNLTFAGAWQLALGLAMIGELGAIYYTVYRPKPLLAGAFFGLALGNRTENLLTAPIFMFLLARSQNAENLSIDAAQTKTHGGHAHKKKTAKSPRAKDQTVTSAKRSAFPNLKNEIARLKAQTADDPRDFIRNLAAFCVVPFALGVATLIYNYLRFQSFTDFGYARIPGVLEEPWYKHGIFSIYYVPGQAWEMLARLWETKNYFPYYVPNGFSSSILFSSPFLFLALQRGARDVTLKHAAWSAIVVLTFLLWLHGNSGGWQFGYRYAMILLPWIFVILLENSPRKISPLEWFLYAFSIAANIYATYLFHWTEYVKV